jgi:ribosomal protein S12 methylthiotransferase
MIVGHPGETQRDFKELMGFIEKIKFDRLGVFTYSHEENTHSYSMKDQIQVKEKQRRADEIMELQSSISEQLNRRRIGQELKVLVDRKEQDYYIGRTEYDSPEVDNEVLIDAGGQTLRAGDFSIVKITDALPFDLVGFPVSKNR